MLERSMRHFARWTILLASIAPILVSAARVDADVVFDNFDTGGGFHPTDNAAAAKVRYELEAGTPLHTIRFAVKFTVQGGDFSLSSITLPINAQNTPAGDYLRARLTSDMGDAPGTTLEVLSEDQPIWPAFSNPFTTATTLSSATHPPLLNGQSYWIVTEPTSIPSGDFVRVDYRWAVNTSGSTVSFLQQVEYDALPSDPWLGSGGSRNVAFRVEGDPGLVGVSDLLVAGPNLALEPTFPNPSARAVTFEFHLGASAAVSCEVFDATGRRVRSLLTNLVLPTGAHRVAWDGRDETSRAVRSGIYLVRCSAGAESAVRRFVRID